MSDVKDEFKEQIEVEGDITKKEKILKTHRVNVQYDKYKENEARVEGAKQTRYGTISDAAASALAQENDEYFEKVSKPLSFICEAFEGRVPFFEKNLILIGGDSGDGKSTAVANIVYELIMKQDSRTGKVRRVLVITNEEDIADFYNRITCLHKGWHYVDHDAFTAEQKKTFSAYIKVLKNRLTVVDDTFGSTPERIITGATTTPEGLQIIFENLIKDKEYYDAILIDYYQGYNESSMDLTMDEFKAQRKLTNVVEKYRKIYPAPIVLMCQVNKDDPEKPIPMKYRIMGTKLIYTRATYVMEMVKHSEDLMTEWIIHKGRFAKLGKSIKTGYHNGAYVPHTQEFIARVQGARELRERAELDKQMGVKVPSKKTEEKVEEKVNG